MATSETNQELEDLTPPDIHLQKEICKYLCAAFNANGGPYGSPTEAAIGITAGLFAIADSNREIARSNREIAESIRAASETTSESIGNAGDNIASTIMYLADQGIACVVTDPEINL